ncbi:hypothetical protein F260042K2_19110 [Flavonifractor plautii]
MSAAPHKAHDFQGVPIRQDGLSVEPLWDDLPVALYRNPPGVKARIGQIVGQGAPGSGRISFAKRQRDMVCRCLVE